MQSQEFENIDWLQIKLRFNLLCNHIEFTNALPSSIYSFQNTVDLISRLSGRRENLISTIRAPFGSPNLTALIYYVLGRAILTLLSSGLIILTNFNFPTAGSEIKSNKTDRD